MADSAELPTTTSGRRRLGAAAQELVRIHVGLAESLARQQVRLSGPVVPHDELAAEARLALAYAASLYDGARGVPFGAYATLVIRHRLAHVVAMARRVRRGPVVAFTDLPGMSLNPICRRTPPAEHLASERELLGRIREALPPRWFEAVDLYYLQGRTFDEVGRHLGFSRERARQLVAKAVRRARERLTTRRVGAFAERQKPRAPR